MVRQRKLFVLLLCAFTLVLTGCGRSPSAKTPGALTLQSLGNPIDARIDDTNRPDPPRGFTEDDMEELAQLMIDLSTASLSQKILDVKDVDDKLDRVLSPLKTSYPETVTDLFKAGAHQYGRHPWQRIFVDPFGPASKPRKPPKILKVAWDAEGSEDSGDRNVLLRLQVHAAYDVGTRAEPSIIVVRRTIELFSYGLDYAPSLGGEAAAYGVDRCAAAIDGDYVSTTDKKFIDEDRRELKKSLASKKIVEDGSGSVADLEKTIRTCRTKDYVGQ